MVTISKESAIEAIKKLCEECDADHCGECCIDYPGKDAKSVLEALPPEEPDIIYCKDCVKHNKRIGDCVEKSDGTYDWIWKSDACPLAEFRGVAHGHEFDYQFCAYGERRTDGQAH